MVENEFLSLELDHDMIKRRVEEEEEKLEQDKIDIVKQDSKLDKFWTNMKIDE